MSILRIIFRSKCQYDHIFQQSNLLKPYCKNSAFTKEFRCWKYCSRQDSAHLVIKEKCAITHLFCDLLQQNTNKRLLRHCVPGVLNVCKRRQSSTTSNGDADNGVNDEADEKEFGEYMREFCAIPGVGHRVLVIQPDIKTGNRRYFMTTCQLKLDETCALIQTLPGWKVVEKKIVRTDQENTNRVFGSGNFDLLLHQIRLSKNISAVVVGIDKLTGLQLNTLQTAWELPVFDRYTVVLQIFRNHAQSPEAKLQVALAEIPYVRSRLVLIHGGFQTELSYMVGGYKAMPLERRNMLLQRRETKLKRQLEKLHCERQEVRLQRVRNSVPTVAVVGYTNAGKTTLIKALTEDPSLEPKNHLFATLDVSAHEGYLASLMKVTFIDTVGFISDMPITLLDAFRATLEDALVADFVVHVRDASHPDKKLQIISVHKTLKHMLPEEKLKNMVDVYNKVDLLSEEELETLDPGILKISAVKGQGLTELGAIIQEKLLATTDHMKKTFRIPNSEPILGWLYKEAAVRSAIPDPKDGQFLIVEVIISKPAYGKFQARFTHKNPKSSGNIR